MSAKHDSFADHWPLIGEQMAPVEDDLPARPAVGHPFWSTLVGSLAGALGGLAMLVVAQRILLLEGGRYDLARVLGEPLTHLGMPTSTAAGTGVLLAIVMGAALGAVLGRVTRRVLRLVPRLLFFLIFAPIGWLFAQAIIIGSLSPSFAQALPFFPLAIGAMVYGLCLAITPPIRESAQLDR